MTDMTQFTFHSNTGHSQSQLLLKIQKKKLVMEREKENLRKNNVKMKYNENYVMKSNQVREFDWLDCWSGRIGKGGCSVAGGEVVGRNSRRRLACGVLTGHSGRTVLLVVGFGAVGSAVAQLHLANQFGSSSACELVVCTTIIHRDDVGWFHSIFVVVVVVVVERGGWEGKCGSSREGGKQ